MVDQLTFFSTNSANGFREWCFVAVEKWAWGDALENRQSFPLMTSLGEVIPISDWHICNNQHIATPEAHPVETRVRFDSGTKTLDFQQSWYCRDTDTGRR